MHNKFVNLIKATIIDLIVALLVTAILYIALEVFLGQEIKKSYVAVLPLIAHLALLITHTIQLLTLTSENSYLSTTFTGCLAIDFIFVLISFFAYLCVDDIEARALGKKSYDNSLDWFWKKV